MSDGDDTRVLNMRINNKQFLSGTADSLKALDTLNKGVDNAGKGPGMQNLGKSVDTVKTKFGALQVAGITALSNITNRAVNAGLRLIKSFTIQPILDGFHEYEKLLTATQTIAANTNNNNAKGIAKVGTYLDALNHYSDLTIYNFGQMADNLARFTAAGVPLGKATTAIKGLSNAAALAGSTNEQLGTAMYQVSQALSTGTIKLMDWNSLSNAGLGGKNLQTSFRAAAASISGSNTAVDAAIKKYGSFRESLRSGWLTADVFTKSMKVFAGQTLDTTSKAKDLQRLGLDKLTISAVKAGKAFKFTSGDVKALTKDGFTKADIGALQLGNTVGYTVKQLQQLGYSKSAAKTLSQLAKDAQDSATKVKTFSQLMGVVKEAIGSGFAGVFRQLFGNLEESSKLWTAVSNVITGAISKIFNALALLLNGWHNTEVVFASGQKIDGFHLIWKAFGHTMQAVGNILGAFFKVFAGFLPSTEKGGNALLSFSKAFFLFSVAIDHATSKGGALAPTIQLLANVFRIILVVIGAVIKSFVGLVQIFAPIGVALGGLAIAIGNLISRLLLLVHISGGIGGLFDGFLDVRKAILEPIVEIIVDMIDALTALVNGDISGFKNKLKDAFSGLVDIGSIAKQGLEIAKGLIDGLVSGLSSGAILSAIGGVVSDMISFFKGLLGIHSPSTVFAEFGKNIVEGLANGLLGAVSLIGKAIKGIGNFLLNADALDLVNAFSIIFGAGVFLVVTKFIKSLLGSFSDIHNIFKGFSGLLNQTTSNLKSMQHGIQAKALLNIAIAIGILAASLWVLSKIPYDRLAVGLPVIVTLLYSLSKVMTAMAKNAATTKTAVASMVAMSLAMGLMAGAILVLSAAVLVFGSMDIKTLGKGLLAVGLTMAALVVAANFLGKAAPQMILAAGGILILSVALAALAPVILLYSKISWKTLGSGLLKMGAALIALALAMAPLSLQAPLLLIASAALVVLSGALVTLLAAIGLYSTVSWGTLISGVAKISVALIALGIAGVIAAPGLLLLGAAAVLIGAGMLAAGIGMGLFAAGLAAVAAAGVAAGAVLAVAFESFLSLLPLFGVQIVAAIDLFLKAVASKSPSMVASGVKIVKSLLKGVRDVLPDIAKTAIAISKTLLDVLESQTENIINAGIKLLKALITGLGDNAGDLVTAAGKTILDFLKAVDAAVTTYEPQILAAGQKIGVDMILGLAKGLLPDFIYTALSDLVTKIVNFFKGLLGINSPSTVFAGFGRNIVEGLANGVTGAISLITGVMSKLVNGAIGIVKGLPGKARAALSGLGGILKAVLASGFKMAVSAVTVGVRNIGTAVSKIAGKIRDAIGAVAGAAKDLGHSIITGIGKGIGAAAGFVVDLARKIKDAVNNALGLPKPIGINIDKGPIHIHKNITIPAFARGVTGFGGGSALVGENGAELVTMGRGSNVVTNENLVAFMKTVSRLTKALLNKGMRNSPGGNIQYVVSSRFVGDPKADGAAFAANIAAGLITGLSDNQTAVNTAMAGVGTEMSKSFQDVLGIASPSKVFHKYAGYVGQGFINGLLASIKGVQKAAVAMAKSATDIVSRTISDAQLKLEAVRARTDAYSEAAALYRQASKNKKLSKAEKKHLEEMAKLYEKESTAAQKAADAQQKKVDAQNAAADRAKQFADADTQGKADLKNEDAVSAAQHASDDRQKALQYAKQADLVRKLDKKKAAELDALSKKWLGYAKTWSDRAAAAAQQASVLSDQAKVEQAAADAAEAAGNIADAAARAAEQAAQISSVSADDVLKAQQSFDAYTKSLADAQESASKDNPPSGDVILNQYNTSPEVIPPGEAYRNGKSLVSIAARKLAPTGS